MSAAGLLLRGAFLEGDAALDAWDAWQASTNLDAVDPECYARLPLLHRKLEVLSADHAELGRLKGVLGQPVAQDLLDALSSSPVSLVERLEYEYVSRPRWQRPVLSWLVARPRRFYRSHS